jgi:hypothetical protein
VGNDQLKKPGGETLVQPDVMGPGGIPGKSALVPQQKPATSAADIGDAWIENRENKSGQGNFLTDVQRERLVTEIKISIRTSEHFLTDALTEIGFDRLIQKEEEVPAIIVLALDIASGFLGNLAGKALKAVRSTPPETFHQTIESMLDFQTSTEDAKDTSLVRNLLNVASPESLDNVIRSAMRTGKTAVTGKLKKMKKDLNADASDRKQVAMSYLDQLKRAAAISYQHLSREAPAVANDAERIALYKSFDAENGHTQPDLKAVLEQKLARYLNSPASEIGRNKHRLKDGASKKDSYNATVRDTQVAWVVIEGDPVPKLYYLREDWANGHGSADGISDPSYKDGHEIERGDPEHFGPSQQGRLTLMRPVEPEFQSTAIERQQQVWGFAPTTRYRSRSELAAETGDQSVLMIPRLDLAPASRKLPPLGPVQGPKPLPPLGPVQGPQPDPNQATAPAVVVPNLSGGTS